MNGVAGAKIQARILKIKEKFVDTLNPRILELDQLLQLLENPSVAADACVEIRKRVHKIHGTAGTLGFARMGALAGQLEVFIDQLLATPPPYEYKFVSELLDSLLNEMESVFEDA